MGVEMACKHLLTAVLNEVSEKGAAMAQSGAVSEIVYEPNAHIVTARASGPYQQEEAEALWCAIDAACAVHATRFVLFDARQRQFAFDASRAFAGFRRLAERVSGKTIALVYRRDHRDIGAMGMVAGESGWNEVQFFDDEAAARTWLEFAARSAGLTLKGVA